MVGSRHSSFRRKGSNWPKVIAITALFGILLMFGYNQDVKTDFGEHMERQDYSNLRLSKLTKSHHSTDPIRSISVNPHHAKKDDKHETMKKNVHPTHQTSANPYEDKIVKEFFKVVSTKSTDKQRQKSFVAMNTKAQKAPVPTKKSLIATKQTVKHIINILAKGTPKKIALKEPEKVVIITPRSKNYTKFSAPPNIFNTDSIGEMGKGVKMPKVIPHNIKKIYKEGWKKNEFNQYLSDLISVHRTLPDFRTDYCKKANYSEKLPETSVIMIFYNEAWSTLLRSVHSVLDRSPANLIAEVILVDDFSTMDHLKQPLDDYFKDYPKVKIMRAKKREGLIRARLIGSAVAKGKVLTFLDSHIECATGWLEPLLDRIVKNPTNVPVPMIDIIDHKTFEVEGFTDLEALQVGGFDWSLTFRWHTLSESERKRKKDPSEPTKSPTMAGGLFSIEKAYFEKLGTYDPDFNIWGGENLELSFKTWMCGGTVEIIPCSHVAHVFRDNSPYIITTEQGVLTKNLVRLAEVWMDDYAQYYYHSTGQKKENYGDISKRLQLRKNLKCKSFKWYLDNIYPELKIPGDTIAYGEVRNVGYGNKMCIDCEDSKEQPASVHKCHLEGGHQYFEYDDGNLCRNEHCIHYDDHDVIMKRQTKSMEHRHVWTYDVATMQFRHDTFKKCLTMTRTFKLLMQECNSKEQGQKWKLQRLKPERLNKTSKISSKKTAPPKKHESSKQYDDDE